ncbi:hypothetical protein [Asanoa siamensis]|uniref:hypothetical protein n=1 Tax=Asanoa siamensis TaxID=926357 RepID=UPI001942DE3E|nr:hypothetical protein [Asanoa siamensis]
MDSSTIALAAVITTGSVGLITPIISAVVTLEGKRHDRRIANDGRVWAERSRLYKDISVWARSLRVLLQSTETAPISPPATLDESVKAELHLYGSLRVNAMILGLEGSLPRACKIQLTKQERQSMIKGTGFLDTLGRVFTDGDSYRRDARAAVEALLLALHDEINEPELRLSLRERIVKSVIGD